MINFVKQTVKALLLLCMASTCWAANIELISGHVRAMPASVPNTAAYLTLINHGKSTKLISVSTPVAKEAQLHTLLSENGVVKMRQVKDFTMASHSALTLQPSGDHIMILGLKKPLSVGDKVLLNLTFSDGRSHAITLPVEKVSHASEQQEDSEHSHHHHH